MSIFRNPPWSVGSRVVMAQELEDVIDWGQSAHNLKNLWPQGTGKGVVIGVCDSGRPTHSDLASKIKASKNFSSSYTDEDVQGHSTHVCGTIAAARNGRGVVGVAYDAELVIAKVLDDSGCGDSPGVAKGIRYCVDQGSHIVSMSVGGDYDPEIDEAVEYALKANVIVICAAGNDGKKEVNTVNWPARRKPVIAVASYNKDGKISEYSSRGPEVDVAFPGENILSCWLGDTYRRLSGTSMAAPFCSGVVAMLLSHQQAMIESGKAITKISGNEDLRRRLKAVAVNPSAIEHDSDWGWGIIKIDALLAQD